MKEVTLKTETNHGYVITYLGKDIIVPKHKVYFEDGHGYIDYEGERLVFKMILENPGLAQNVWYGLSSEILPYYLDNNGNANPNLPEALRRLIDEVKRIEVDDGKKDSVNANVFARLVYIAYTPKALIDKYGASGFERVKEEIVERKGGFKTIERWVPFIKKTPPSRVIKYVTTNKDILDVSSEGTSLSQKLGTIEELVRKAMEQKEESSEAAPALAEIPTTPPLETTLDFVETVKTKYPDMYVDLVGKFGDPSDPEVKDIWLEFSSSLPEDLPTYYKNWKNTSQPEVSQPEVPSPTLVAPPVPVAPVAPPSPPVIEPVPEEMKKDDAIYSSEEESMKGQTRVSIAPKTDATIEIILNGVVIDGVKRSKRAVMNTVDKERKCGPLRFEGENKSEPNKFVVITKGPDGEMRPKIITLVKERKIEDVPEAIQNIENEKITTYLKKPNVRVRESSTAFGKGKDANGKGQGVRLSLEYRVGQLYYNLGKVFSFPNEMTQKVFTAMWLVKNGSLVLKGPPGTGKTTLTETSTYLLCNNIDYEKSNEQYESWSENVEGMFVTKPYTGETEYSLRDIDFFIKSEFGTVGIAKHNPDKTPDEILYKTQIVLDKIMFDSTRTNPPEITRKHIGWVPGLKIDDTFKNNPASVTSGKFVERQEYNFIPMPRNIVTSPIKFHNECSRMSSVVADAVLGLMSEGQVEHLGSVFESPSEGIGSISIYDLNPHLEKMDRGLDWAFNDRIDVEIWLPSGKLYDYWQVMKKRVNIEPIISESKREKEMGKKIEGKETVLSRTTVGDPRAIVAGLMNYTVPWFPSKLPWVDNNTVGYKFIEPLTYDELQILWKRIESTKINEGLLVRVAAVMRLFSVSWYRYPESVYKQTNLNEYLKKNGIGYEFIDGHKEKDNPNAFIDTSYATVQYSQSGNKTKSASVEMSDSSAKQTAESYLSYASNPLGMRAIISLIQVARAIKFLETAIKTYDNKKGFEFTDMEKMKMTIDEDKDDSDYFWSLIPFVVSHRIHGTRIHPSIYDNYLNVQDWVENIIEPFRKTHFKLWDAMIKSIEETLDVGAQPQVIPLFDQNQNVAILRFADIQMKCPECGGDGKIKGSGSPKVEVTCGRCKGSGEIPFEYPTSKKSVEKITPRDVGEAFIEYFNHKFWKTFESRASKTKDDYFVSSGKAASIRSTDPILYEISCMFQNLQTLNKIRLDDAERVRDIPKAETKKK